MAGTASEDAVRAALERHRDDPTPRLTFTVPLDRLLDPTYCKVLTQDLSTLTAEGWEVRRATPLAWRMLPAQCGLYMFIWRPTFSVPLAAGGAMEFPWILYVGRAGGKNSYNTLRSRYRSEYANLVGGDPERLWETSPANNRETLLGRYLTLRPLEYWFCVIDNLAQIDATELRLIKLFAPPLNSTGGPRLRPSKAIPAF